MAISWQAGEHSWVEGGPGRDRGPLKMRTYFFFLLVCLCARASATAEHAEHLFRQCSAAPALTQAESRRDPTGIHHRDATGAQSCQWPRSNLVPVSLLLPGEFYSFSRGFQIVK